jgi:predicted RNA binding protein YcfA (HicA-like mRNA interferase family)
MPELPRVNAKETIRALRRAGFELERTKGSHQLFRRASDGRQVTVPLHGSRTLKLGTLRNILRQAGMTVEEFREWLA